MNNLFLMFFYDVHISEQVPLGENMTNGVCVPGLTQVVVNGINYDSLSGYSIPDRLQNKQSDSSHIRTEHSGQDSDTHHLNKL